MTTRLHQYVFLMWACDQECIPVRKSPWAGVSVAVLGV